jgi:hypothetical protein
VIVDWDSASWGITRMVLATDSAQLDVAKLKQHVSAMAVFLRRHEWLWRSHVVDFFKVSSVPCLRCWIGQGLRVCVKFCVCVSF